MYVYVFVFVYVYVFVCVCVYFCVCLYRRVLYLSVWKHINEGVTYPF